jgi:1-acyl-sn-glycerol-3-phosphate acyltransferase
MKLIYRIGYWLFRAVGWALFDFTVVGREKLPGHGAALIACNHASFLDPPLVGSAFRSEIHYLARKTLFVGFGAWLYPRWNSVPVDQERADFSSLKTIIKLLKDGRRVLIFPEGKRTQDGGLQRGQPGVGLVIAKAGVPVVPVRLFGTFEALPRGARWPAVVPVTLVVGDPVPLDDLLAEAKSGKPDKSLYQRISDRVMDAIGALALPD